MQARTAVIRRLWQRRAVRRVEVAFAGFTMAEYGAWVAVLVYGYERGGTTQSALVAVAQLLPPGSRRRCCRRSLTDMVARRRCASATGRWH